MRRSEDGGEGGVGGLHRSSWARATARACECCFTPRRHSTESPDLVGTTKTRTVQEVEEDTDGRCRSKRVRPCVLELVL